MTKVGKNESCPCGSKRKFKKCCGTSSYQRSSNPVLVRRQDIWRRKYRVRRYLEYLSREELEQRAKDVFVNLHVLSDQLKFRVSSKTDSGGYWQIMWTHVLEEFALRYGPFPSGFMNGFIKDAAIPRYNFENMGKVAAAAKTIKPPKGGFLFKFGQYKFLCQTLETGSIRILPASSYNDPSLNQAIRDEELQLSFSVLPSEIVIEAEDDHSGESVGFLQPRGNVTFTIQAPTNFYAYCMASAYSLRLFGDFEADACLVITRPKEFKKILIEEFEKKMTSWKCVKGEVNYFDPLNVNRKLDAFLSKHFRYTYQKEYRVLWLPPVPEKRLEPIYLELGDLREYCKLISLLD